jgi:ATP-dependent DNA helicase RecQ
MDLPDSLEAYFQEAGRAGRDLKPSEAFLLVADSDIKQLKDNLQQSYPDLDKIKTIYEALGNYLQIPVGAGNGQSYPFDMTEFATSYGFSLLEVFNSLKLMEREGFFALSEAMDSPSQLFIKASREDLYRFQVEYPDFDVMIKYLLRNYPGILSDFVKIREEQISHKLGIDVVKVEQTLKQLEKFNFLTYIQRSDKPQILFLTERQDTRHFILSDEVYKNRKDDATKRVQAVIDFVNNDTECRSVQLLRYFGEKINTRCGKCDVCNIRNQMNINDEEYKNISELILQELKKRVVPLYETPSLAKNYFEEKVLETVRWMLDSGIIEQDENGNLKEKGKQQTLF